MNKLLLLVLALLVILIACVVTSCLQEVQDASSVSNASSFERVTDVGLYTVFYYHDIEHEVGIWICGADIAVLPDQYYINK